MRRGTTKHPAVGMRVQIPAYADLWMRGARFGEIARVIEGGRYLDPRDPRGRTLFLVRLDAAPRRAPRFIADDCRFV